VTRPPLSSPYRHHRHPPVTIRVTIWVTMSTPVENSHPKGSRSPERDGILLISAVLNNKWGLLSV
jgi:hypothetical protein